MWSIGTVIGALAGTLLAVLEAPSAVFFLTGALIVTFLNLATFPLWRDGPWREPLGTRSGHDEPHADHPVPETRVRVWTVRPLVLLAAMGIAVSVLEGSPVDWGALYLADEIGASAGVAAAATVAYTVGMVVTRLGGDHLVARFGVPRVLRVGAASAAVAITLALVFDHPAVVLAGWFVAGAGVATCYPALYVAAGRTPGLPPGAAIGAVTSVAARRVPARSGGDRAPRRLLEPPCRAARAGRRGRVHHDHCGRRPPAGANVKPGSASRRPRTDQAAALAAVASSMGS